MRLRERRLALTRLDLHVLLKSLDFIMDSYKLKEPADIMAEYRDKVN